ncbi:uncharacterized protein LOC114881524 [Osmia bicornis bicornis]|uniref:uncharacterized protein LOC114881524 n=1 Tax=Osmia bicornis bicornis TaxID=1437191 RepID=UPI001EAE9D6B|nr:uncharacterized protein LOC114881524 [Osmia bicornis bicornis]
MRQHRVSAYVDHDRFSTIEEAYLQVAAQMAQYQEDLAQAGPSRGVQPPPETPEKPQLPKIQLPTFSGDPLKWESFRDLFKSLVHSVPNLQDVRKLLYLKSALTGEAAEVIQNTPITDAGYQGAWEDLEQRPKLYKTTHLVWETSLADSRDVPSFRQLSLFLENRIQALDAAQEADPVLHPATSKGVPAKTKREAPVKRTNVAVLAASAKSPAPRKCPSCAGNHNFAYCSKLKALPPRRRKERAQQLQACFNCLTVGHDLTKCPSSQVCLACGHKHHTLLHDAMPSPTKNTPANVGDISTSQTSTASTETEEKGAAASFACSATTRPAALLATAKVKVEAPSGELLEVRALLDTGSDTSLVSAWVAQALRLPRRAVSVAISGVQENESGVAKSEVSLSLRSRLDPSFHLSVRALVLRKLTALLPARAVHSQSWLHLQGVTLADPEYGVPSRIDLILGADICGVLLQDESRVGPVGTPTARRTPFGWVLMGPVSDTKGQGSKAVVHSLHCQTDDSTNRLLRRFWEVEELHEQPPLSLEERESVSAGWHPTMLFSQFMEEYAALDHMEAVPESAVQDPAYYLPHHAVVKRYDSSGKSGSSSTPPFAPPLDPLSTTIRVHHTDADWTRILWRSRPDQPVQDFRLKTVTYGTACAPFLALRVLVQLAEDEEERFPLGAVAIRRHSYVDDILAGADDEKAALELRRQVISILQSGGFDLSKWASNKPSLQEAEEFQTCVFQDYPGVKWDEDLPEQLLSAWETFRSKLSQLDALAIPRWTNYSADIAQLELHGFCDASQRAYAAVVYLRVSRGESSVATLLVAKTKVAPVKALSIPRLELCGAVLLSKLIAEVQKGLILPATITAWTDSSVTLHWIKGHASTWKPFVAHRVATVQSNVPPQNWRHVATKNNPADLATRGITPSELLSSHLWWSGPSWLVDSPDLWPASPLGKVEEADLERGRAQIYLAKENEENDLLSRFSSLTRLTAVIALCSRFHRLTRKLNTETGFIRASERDAALRIAIGLAQKSDFQSEVDQLQQSKEVRRSSALRALKPFLDDQGLLRVGGRLDLASIPYNERHPYIIGKKNALATLLVRDAHLRTLHGGPQLTRSMLARRYWIIHGRSLVRDVIKGCVKCARYSGRPTTQLMAPLPLERITPRRPFLSTGVDYAGPVKLRTSPGRGHKSYKGYIALFICLTTRAFHLEAVSDLTSASFLAAFRRFVSRRGRCATMLRDNGTVFHGADRELRNMFRGASAFYLDAAASLAADGTDWSFIPPYAPHFGGLWEAGVRTVKHHLLRIVENATLTFEEMTTLLCQVEACVNSRPLHPLSDDPSDLSALTPGHFLIGEPTCIVPDPESESHNISLISRWRQISILRSHFWHRWRREYLQSLQQLPKWRQQKENL